MLIATPADYACLCEMLHRSIWRTTAPVRNILTSDSPIGLTPPPCTATAKKKSAALFVEGGNAF